MNSKSSELTEVKKSGTKKKRPANKIEMIFRKKLSFLTFLVYITNAKEEKCFLMLPIADLC